MLMKPSDGPDPHSLPMSPNSTAGEEADPELPMLFCPVCNLHLVSRKCKLFCERCGYYMSCADYY
jgi:hypothetical protein